jgi:hypothetical protein
MRSRRHATTSAARRCGWWVAFSLMSRECRARPVSYRATACDHDGGSEPGKDPSPATSTMSFALSGPCCPAGRRCAPGPVGSFGWSRAASPSSRLKGSAPLVSRLGTLGSAPVPSRWRGPSTDGPRRPV